MHFNTYKNTLHLDPGADGTGGGAAAAGSPAGGAAPADSFDASKYVPREDFERISNDYSEFRQTAEQRFQEYDTRLPKPEKQEAKTDKEPDFEDGTWDFSKPGEFQRYQRELTAYHLNKELSQRDQQAQESQREQGYKQYVQSTQDSHRERADQFRAANPDYDPNKSIVLGNDAVALAVLESDFSANIHHYLQKNPDKTAELKKLATSNPAAAIRMVGRLESQFESQAAIVPAKKSAASAQPTSNGFGSGKHSGTKVPSREEIFKSWNS